jgi:Domain of unknown function (DUF4388)
MLKGTLDDFSLPDVFRLMSLAKKTGRLDVERKAGNGKVYFRDGEVYFAESSLSREPLGQKLVRAGVLTEGQLRKALDQHSDTGERVGDILVNSGIVQLEQISIAIRQQIEDAVFDLLRWELGEFNWDPEVELEVEVPIRVSVENLIMESSRRLDELEVIKRKIPSPLTILAMAPKPPEGALEINITPEEWRVLVLVDGTRTVADIAAMVGMDEFQAMRTMYGLVSAGLVEVAHPGEGVEFEPYDEPEAVEVTEPEAEAAEPAAEEPEPEPEPEVDTEVEAETEAEPELEPVAELEAELGETAYEPERRTSSGLEPELGSIEDGLEPVADFETAEGELETISAAEGSEGAELSADELLTGGEPPEEWFQDPEVGVESFDAPGPDELVMETLGGEQTDESPADQEVVASQGDTDSFLGDLLESETTSSEAPAPPSPEAPHSPRVDRAAVVRELAGLFSDEGAGGEPTARPRSVPAAPRPATAPAASAEDESGSDDARKRVEDDDQVTKGLISRLIDGVKGL